jgi:hypothetical protein
MTSSDHPAGTCQWCVNVRTLGWIGDSKVSHCLKCHATWNRDTNTAHCTVCHRTFGSNSAADMHRPGNGKCLDPETVMDSNGEPKFGEPRTTRWGTLVWRKVDRRWHEREESDNEDTEENG